MILRRVIAHFRQQEWTAIAIDFLIVVVGVFVGLQVNNWNEALADRAREATHLAGLARDIHADIADIDEIIRVSGLRLSAMAYLLEQASGQPLPGGFDSARGRIEIEPAPDYAAGDPASIGVAMFILTTLDGNRLTYETMINTGDVGVIRNRALVRQMQAYYAAVDKVLSFEDALEINRVKLVDAQQQAGLSPVDLTPADELATIFGRDRQLLAAARNYWLYTNRHLKLMKELRAEAEQLADALGQEAAR